METLSHKAEAAGAVIRMVRLLENKTGLKLQVLRSDRGGEYLNSQLKGFCAHNGIKPDWTAPYSSQQNGQAERFNRTLEEMARTQLISSGLPHQFWPYAVLISAYQRNRAPQRGTEGNKSPWELSGFGGPTDVNDLHVFGEDVFVLIPKEQRRSKLGPTSQPGRFLGYDPNSKAFKILVENQRVITNRDVTFKKGGSSVVGAATEEVAATAEDGGDDATTEEVAEIPPAEPRRSTRERRTVDRLTMSAVEINHIPEPRSFKEAEASAEALQWAAAREEEMSSIYDQGVLMPVSSLLPYGRKPLPTKFVYKVKTLADGTVERFKARLVVLGHYQKYGAVYTEVYAPTGRFTTLRALLAISAVKGLVLKQLDVKTAFLNAPLEEDIYRLRYRTVVGV